MNLRPRSAKSNTALDFFMLLFTVELATKIAGETNEYAIGEIRKQHDRSDTNSKPRVWVRTCCNEIYRFIGIAIYMGLEPRKGGYGTYWDRTTKGGSKGPDLGRYMHKNRYLDLRKYLHFADNEKQVKDKNSSSYDKLSKIRMVLDFLNKNFQKYFVLGDMVSIDEAMAKFFGRTYLKMFMPNKPTKYGFKLWCLCDPTTGYFYRIDVYAGKRPGEAPVVGLGTRVVLDLVDQSKCRQGTVALFDRFFGSLTVLEELQKRGLHGVCTMMQNRVGFPKELVELSKKEPRGTIKHATSLKKNISVVTWNDNSVVTIAGTVGQVRGGVCERRARGRGNGGVRREIPRPPVIELYNKGMGGVDLGDKLRGHLAIEAQQQYHKWYKKLFFAMVGMLIVNCFILFCKTKGDGTWRDKQLHTNFLYDLQEQLLGLGTRESDSPPKTPQECFTSSAASSTRSSSNSPTGSTSSTSSTNSEEKQKLREGCHTVERISKGQRECVYCKTVADPPVICRTIYKCKECDAPLCCNAKNCFYLFHQNSTPIRELFVRKQYKQWKKQSPTTQ